MADTSIQSTPQAPPVKQVKVKRKKSKKKFFIIGSIVLLLLIITAVVVSGKKEKAIEVQTEKVSKRNITQVVTATGKIQSETEVKISAEVSGEIVSLPYKEGDEVKKGSMIVKIKPDVYYPQLQQQLAGVRVQQTRLQSQEVNLRSRQRDLQRVQELFNKGLAPQSELDNAQNQVDALVADMNTTRAQINQQQASLSSVQYDLSKTTIYAPMDGTVTALNNETGEKVLGTISNQGSNIMVISDLAKMECQVEVGETDVTQISLGDTASIEIDAFPDRIFKGYVYEIANSAQTQAAGTQNEVVNFIVKIRIIDNNVDLRPGMSCTVDIEVEKKNDVISIPIQSVTTRDQEGQDGVMQVSEENENLSRGEEKLKKMKPKEIVFVIENGVSKQKEVTTGISNDNFIEITGGLNEGEEIVKGPFKAITKELQDNVKVAVNNTGGDKKVKKEEEGS
jgi:HlyD family secretion protein